MHRSTGEGVIVPHTDALTRTRQKRGPQLLPRDSTVWVPDSAGQPTGGPSHSQRPPREITRTHPTVPKGHASMWARSKHRYSSTITQSCRPSDAK